MPAILDGSPKGFEPHQLSAEELPRQLQVDAAQGLLTEEARRRLVEHGPNELKERSARKPWAILWRFWCKLLKGSVSCDNCRDDGTDLGTRFVQGTAL